MTPFDVSFDPIFTNVAVYGELASESLEAAEAFLEANRRPKDDGSAGHILTHDPDRRSLKHSFVAIAFAGMFMEAALWLYGTRKLGVDKYKPIDRWNLEMRLQPLGLADEDLEAKLKNYRETRKDMVHEKAVPFSQVQTPTRYAQKEARKSVEVMLQLEEVLRKHGMALR